MNNDLGNHDRSIRLWGQEAFEKLQKSRICVLGLGGVGSFCVSSLARGGLGSLLLIDGDVVDPSNMNRQAFAFVDTIGYPKTEIAKRFVSQVAPKCDCKFYDSFITTDNFDDVESVIRDFKPDWIVDAIDSITIKLLLAQNFVGKSGIEFIAATGAANKTDASKLTIAKLSQTKYDPICKIMRSEMKKRHIADYRVCFSTEEVRFSKDAAITRTGKKKILGSTSFIPAIMGHMLAGYVMNEITGRLK